MGSSDERARSAAARSLASKVASGAANSPPFAQLSGEGSRFGRSVSQESDQAASVIESANSPYSPCLVARAHERVYTGAPFGDCSLQGSNLPRNLEFGAGARSRSETPGRVVVSTCNASSSAELRSRAIIVAFDPCLHMRSGSPCVHVGIGRLSDAAGGIDRLQHADEACTEIARSDQNRQRTCACYLYTLLSHLSAQ